MARKRPDGDGTLYYSEARQRWVVQLPADPLTGKRPIRYCKTEREALELKRLLERERSGGRDLTIKQPTLAAFLDIWLAEVVKETLRPSTHDGYCQMCRLYIIPHLGRHRVEALTTPLIQQWINGFKAKGLAPSVARSAFARLRSALDVAVSWGYIARNPTDGVKLPKLLRKEEEDMSFTLAEAQALVRAAEGWRLEPLIWILLLLGLRKGEALGLAWRDYSATKHTIKITQQVQLIDKKVVISLAPKTDASRRELPTTSGLDARICAAWSERGEERALRGVEWKEHGLLFPSEAGTPLVPRNFNTAFERLCVRAKVRTLPVHALRHTCATLLAEQGEQEVLISTLLGHTATNVTRRYEHLREALRAALERLEHSLLGTADAQRAAH